MWSQNMDLKKYNWPFTLANILLIRPTDGQPDTCDLQIFSGAVFAAKKDNSMDWLTLEKLASAISVSCCQRLVFSHILIWQLLASLTNHKYTSANFFYLAWQMINYLPLYLLAQNQPNTWNVVTPDILWGKEVRFISFLLLISDFHILF